MARKGREGQRGKEWKDDEVRTARKGLRGNEGLLIRIKELGPRARSS